MLPLLVSMPVDTLLSFGDGCLTRDRSFPECFCANGSMKSMADKDVE